MKRAWRSPTQHPPEDIVLSVDMEKVILLPRMPGYKIVMFTPWVVAINKSFVPVKHEESKVEIAPIAVIWHDGIMGCNDEDVASSFIKALSLLKFAGTKIPSSG